MIDMCNRCQKRPRARGEEFCGICRRVLDAQWKMQRRPRIVTKESSTSNPTPRAQRRRALKTIEQNNADFGRRVRAFHRSEEGRAIREQLTEIQKQLFNAYKQIALDHWQANGNSASTGWGCIPEEQYSSIKRKPADCAYELANKLTEYMMENPYYGLGYK